MLADFDFLIIETYTQLAWVVAALVFVIWTVQRARRALQARHNTRPAPAAVRDQQSRRLRPATRAVDFDRLAVLVADASARAARMTAAQSTVSIKLDATEMAVNRLAAEFASVIAVRAPRNAGVPMSLMHPLPPIARPAAAASSRASIAA